MDKLFSKKKLLEFVFILLGVAIFSFVFSFFLNSRDLVIGGVSGIGVILKKYIPGFDPAITILIINMALLGVGYLFLGKDFFFKTALGSIAFPAFIFIFDKLLIKLDLLAEIQSLDMVLVVLFSMFLTGLGLGIVLKFGGTTGGTEIIQKIMHKYLHIPYSTTLYVLDGLVVLLGYTLGIMDLQTALYAIIFIALAGVVIDRVVYSGFNRRAVYIISKHNEKIKDTILKEIERGLTSIKVVGEYTKNEQEMLLCVLDSRQFNKLQVIINQIDPTAFYFAVRANEVGGEGFTYD